MPSSREGAWVAVPADRDAVADRRDLVRRCVQQRELVIRCDFVQQRPQLVRHRVVVEEFRLQRVAQRQHLRSQVRTRT